MNRRIAFLRWAGAAGILCSVITSCTPAAPPTVDATPEAATGATPQTDPHAAPVIAPHDPPSPEVLRDVPGSFSAPLPAKAQRWIDETVASLTLRDRIGQMVMIWVLGDYTSTSDSSFAEAAERIELDKVGGIVMSLGSPIEVAAKINALQRLSEIPLLVSSDVEPGLGRLEGGVFAPGLLEGGSATVLPSNMAIGATGSARLAREAGRVTGAESRAIGIHLAFAPAVDVNNNPNNPVINVRSFGEDPKAVARLGAAFVQGVQGEHVAATIKHFPGHGDTDTDSHLALPIVSASRERLDSLELLPFRAGIEAGAAAVMSAHIALPAVSGDSTPATLAPSIMHDLLRDTLGFGGLVVTDAMDMRGVGAGYGVAESAVRAVKAGTDILLMPPDIPAAISAVAAAVERGEISHERIEQSVRRILELKIRTGAVQRPIVPLDSLRDIVGSRAHRQVAEDIATSAITLLRNDEFAIPFSAGPPTLLLTFAGESNLRAGRTFAAEVRRELRNVRVERISPSTPRARLDSLLRPDERVLVATFVRTIEGEGAFAVGEHIARWIDSVATQRPVTVVAFSNPYVLREFPQVSGYVATFGRGEALERAAAQAVTGRIPFRGRAPISLPGFFRAGAGYADETSTVAPLDAEAATDSLRALLQRGVADSVFPGAIAIIGDHRGVIARVAAGHIDWADNAPAPAAETVWDLASLTKVIGMTTAMMQLVEQGRVVLDAPVQRYLPEWTGPGKELVTIRHLLTHSSGLRAWRELYKETDTAREARRLVLATPLDTLPGLRYEYSDLGAILAGMVIERVTDQSLDDYLHDHVFDPLGMDGTRYKPPRGWRQRIAPTEVDPWRGRHLRGEVHDENAFRLGGVSAHAGLFGTAADLARFARMLLNGGELDGTRIVKEETIRRFTRVQNHLLSHRAVGWETPNGTNSAGHVLHRPAFGHTGFTGTSIWIDPENDRFVLLMTNRVNPSRENSRIGPVRTAVADLAGVLAPRGAPTAARGTP
ncbi:MAG TPA: glycoside hydrolase family 3 N-terminal domain-containing protein [Gemmatimonadaceae bacterium]|nr:glycoside hydrolase family 3 N-terminal domain-containing protein [Gemmatimonadaceae bacterium]